MISSSVRKIGFAGIATLLLVSGLATSALTAQAVDDGSGPMTLLESPALGSLSSLGGVSGYINSQAGGNINSWLTGQGIDPTASGSITDTSVPAQAQGKITVDKNNGSVSLASDADGVNVGYLVGDAVATDNLSVSMANVAVAPGHSNDSYTMTTAQYLAWTSGTTWEGHYSLPGIFDTDFTVSWTPTGAVVTPHGSTQGDITVAQGFQTTINNAMSGLDITLPLSDVVGGIQDYTWNKSFDLPYSFAYSVGQALAPGGSVSVNLQQLVSGSLLNDFNLNDHTSGVLTAVPLTAWLSEDNIRSLSQLDGFAGLDKNATTADMATLMLNQAMLDGDLDEWASGVVIEQVQNILSGIPTVLAGYTLDPLDQASKDKIQANTPAIMETFVDGGFSNMITHGVSASLQTAATVDPGTVTSLTPTGVTVAAAPVEVNADASTLTLSAPGFNADPQAVCAGDPVVSPASITATATVVDTTGAPVSGTTVTFSVQSPLVLDHTAQITDENGVATVVITLPTDNPSSATTQVTAHVNFGAGADLSPAQLTISAAHNVAPAPPSLSVEPTVASPVAANGEDSYTASVTFVDQCGAQAGKTVDFSVTGSAQLSSASDSSDGNGIASVTLTDTVPESVVVTAKSAGVQIGDPVMVTFISSGTPTESSSPTQSPSVPPTESPSPAQSPTAPPSESPSPAQSPTQSPSSTESPSPAESPTAPPSEPPSPAESPTESPTSPSSAAPTEPVCTAYIPGCSLDTLSGALTLDPTQVSDGGSTVATATIVNAQGEPVPGVSVNFGIGGNAQFADGPAAVAAPTDANGQTVMLITATPVDCDNPGFDVYASFTMADQTFQLTGSPARVTVVPDENACEVQAAPPQVILANAAIIAGNAIPGATVQVVNAAGAVLGTSPVDMTGYWSIPTPAGTPSQQITANALNSKGAPVAATTAWLDTDPPATARIDRANTQEVAGNVGAVENAATLTIIFPDGTMIMALANADGSYSVATPDGMPEGVVTVVVTDTAGNPSGPVTANLVTYVPPVSTITVSVSNTQVAVGGKQTVTGSGFRYLERVTAQLCSTTCTTVGNGYAGYNGQVTIAFTVPATTALGSYTVTLTGPTSGTGSAGFQVIPPAAPAITKGCAYLQWWAKWWWLFA